MEFKSITNKVTEYLRNQIIIGEFKSDQRLNETELASALDISRPPIREAFRMLENEHLVVSMPRKGTFVTRLSAEDLREVYQSREMIECYAVDLLKEKQISALPKVEAALEAASKISIPSSKEPEKILAFHRVSADFHIKLVEAAGNRRLIRFYQGIFSNLARYQFRFLRIPGSAENNVKEHDEILNAFKKGDYDHAKENLRIHIKKRLHEGLDVQFG